MQFLRLLEISTAKSRTAAHWKQETVTWPDFCARLAACMDKNRGSETHAAYLAMSRDKQAALKDVGGFVGGALRDGVRKHGHCSARSLITLDLDNCDPGSTDSWLDAVKALGCAAAVTFACCALSVIYLKLLFWRDEHDLNTSGIAMSVSAVFASCVVYSVASALVVVWMAA